MLATTILKPLALAALLLSSTSNAAPHSGKPNASARITKRQDTDSSSSSSSGTTFNTTSTNGTATLAPVVPPDVNQDALSTLLGGTNVTLAWAGSPNSTASSQRKLKRDEGVLSQATFTFKYPTVALDHSNFISDVSCSGNILTGVLTTQAYSYAKSKWAGFQDMVFVTSVNGCGMDDANEFFHATSVVFNDSTQSFSATGASAGPKDVSSYMVLEWGAVGAANVKRASDKKDMFEPHALHERGTYEVGLSVPFRAYAHEILGSDPDAPWDNAWKVGETTKEEGEEDDSWEKGEVASESGHHKRSTNETELSLYQRDLVAREFSYGMALYCVDCGFEGQAGLYGRLETDWFDIVGLGAGFRMDFQAGIYLGLVAYVKYEKEWPKEIAHVNLAGWEVPLIISVGPFIDVSLVPSFEISASGSLLIGAGIEWDNVDIYLDFLHPIDNSYAHNLVPSFQHRIEAAGELSVEAKLALPVKLGLEIKILSELFSDDWIFNAEAAIVEEPAIVAEGKFEVSAEVTDDGEIEYDINGGCYGVAWDIHFENDLYFEAKADFFGLGDGGTWPLLSFESDPFAEGCIGYVDDGTDDNGDDAQGSGDSTGLGGNGLNSGGDGLAGSSNGNDDDSDSSVALMKAMRAGQVITSSTSTSTSTSTSSSTSSSTISKGSSTSTSISTTSSKSSSTSTSTSTSKSSSTSTSTSTNKSSSTSTSTTSSKSSSTSTSTSSSSSSTSKSTTPVQAAAQTTSSSISKTSTTSSTTFSTSKSSTTSNTPNQAQQTSSKTSTSSSTSKLLSTSTTSTKAAQTTTSKPTTTSTSTKTTSKSTSTTPTCIASQSAVAKSPAPTGITCKSVVKTASVPASVNLGSATTVNTADLCAMSCLQNKSCLSFSYNGSTKSCQLYNKAVKNLGTTSKSSAPTLTFYDRDCYIYNTCSK